MFKGGLNTLFGISPGLPAIINICVDHFDQVVHCHTLGRDTQGPLRFYELNECPQLVIRAVNGYPSTRVPAGNALS